MDINNSTTTTPPPLPIMNFLKTTLSKFISSPPTTTALVRTASSTLTSTTPSLPTTSTTPSPLPTTLTTKTNNTTITTKAFIKSALIDIGLSLISVVLSVAVVHLLFESKLFDTSGGTSRRPFSRGTSSNSSNNDGTSNNTNSRTGKPMNKTAHSQRIRLIQQQQQNHPTTPPTTPTPQELILAEIQKRRSEAIFDEWEDIVATDMVFPEDISGGFDHVGGLEKEKQEIYELITLPMRRPDLFRNRTLIAPPKGVLLYGPPGTGKSLIARAIAKESGACFIDFKMSSVMSMWFGESQKLIRATFSLARKLSPAVIFIDEIDSFLRKRRGEDHPSYENMKAEFMSLWDGLTSEGEGDERDYGVIVIGATNRPFDLDPAILRRLPRTFEIHMPNSIERLDILNKILQFEDVQDDLKESLMDLATEELQGYSGSDLKELCRAAAAKPLREMVRQQQQQQLQQPHQHQHHHQEGQGQEVLRPISLEDFKQAMKEVRPSGETAREYMYASSSAGGGGGGNGVFFEHGLDSPSRMSGGSNNGGGPHGVGRGATSPPSVEESTAFVEGMKKGYVLAVMNMMNGGMFAGPPPPSVTSTIPPFGQDFAQ